MTKITLSDLSQLTTNELSALSTINANNATIEAESDNFLSRDGTSPNAMAADLDMDGNSILNLPDPTTDTEPVTKGYGDDAYGNALEHAEDAEASATAAAASASASATSASASSTSASAASTSATNAATSATNAATSASAAATSATTAATNATVVAGLKYRFDNSTSMADPGSSDLRMNHATVASVTALAIDAVSLDSGTPDASDFIATWDDSTNTTVKGYITLRKLGTPATFAIFSVSAITDNGGWLQATVAHVASSGTWTALDEMSVQFTRAGDKGADGANGTMTGPVSSTDNAIARFDGTGGTSVQNSAVTIADTTGVIAGTQGVIFSGSSSGTTTVQATAAAGSGTLTLPTATGTLITTGGVQTMTGGFKVTPYAAGTKSSGTYTPLYSDGNMQTATNGGAHTLAPQADDSTIIIQYTNNASAGAVTTSGFTRVSGSFTTTNGDDFFCYLTKIGSFSHLNIIRLQ